MRNVYATEQADRRVLIEAAKARIEDLVKAGTVRKQEQTAIDEQLKQCKTVLDSHQALRNAQKEHKENKAKRQTRREEMVARLQGLQEQQAAANELRNASMDRLARAQKAKDASDELKAANDHIAQTVILPGKNEMLRLAEAKEAFAAKLGQHHKTAELDRAEEKRALDAAEERKTMLKDRVEQLVSERKIKEDEKSALARTHEGLKKTHLDRIESLEALDKNYRETIKTTERNAKLVDEECRTKMENEFQEFVRATELEYREKKQLNAILDTGVEMLQSTIDAENAAGVRAKTTD